MEPPSFWYDRNFFASVEEALDFVRELLAVDAAGVEGRGMTMNRLGRCGSFMGSPPPVLLLWVAGYRRMPGSVSDCWC